MLNPPTKHDNQLRRSVKPDLFLTYWTKPSCTNYRHLLPEIAISDGPWKEHRDSEHGKLLLLLPMRTNFMHAGDDIEKLIIMGPSEFGGSAIETGGGFSRYITIEIIPTDKQRDGELRLHQLALQQTILAAVQQLHGDFGVGSIMGGFSAKYCNEVTRIGIIRVRHGPHRLVASCLPLIKNIGHHNVMVHTLYTGASLHHCYSFLVKYQKKELARMWMKTTSKVARQEMEARVMNLKLVLEFERRKDTANSEVEDAAATLHSHS